MQFRNGDTIDAIGLGTWKSDPGQAGEKFTTCKVGRDPRVEQDARSPCLLPKPATTASKGSSRVNRDSVACSGRR